MITEEIIKVEMMNELNKEMDRLGKIAKEKEKLPVMARIVILACALLAKADGKTTVDELYGMKNTIFKRFCINDTVFNTYLPLFSPVSPDINLLSFLQKDIEQYNIDKNFLEDLYNELRNLTILKKLTPAEEEVFSELFNIFDFPTEEPEDEPEEDGVEGDSTGNEDYYPEKKDDDPETEVEVDETE